MGGNVYAKFTITLVISMHMDASVNLEKLNRFIITV